VAAANDGGSFTGFPVDAFGWFVGLTADNSRPYFEAHRETYDRDVRGAVEALLEELAEEFGGRVKLFRQNRDVRFSADKSPYKTTTYGLILDRLDSQAPLYAQLSQAGLFAGSGYYQLAADQITRLRDAIVDDRAGAELERLVTDLHEAGVETFGEALKTAPRGYDRDHPRVHLLRHKSIIAGLQLPSGPRGIPRATALQHARSTWLACAQLNIWLDENVGQSELPPPPPRGGPRRAR